MELAIGSAVDSLAVNICLGVLAGLASLEAALINAERAKKIRNALRIFVPKNERSIRKEVQQGNQ